MKLVFRKSNKQTNYKRLLLYMICYVAVRLSYEYMITNMLPSVWSYTKDGVITYGLQLNIQKRTITWIIFLLFGLVNATLNDEDRFENIVLNILFLLYYMPMNCAYYLYDMDIQFLVLFNIYWLLLCLLTKVTFLTKNIESPQNTLEERLQSKPARIVINQRIRNTTNILLGLYSIIVILYKIYYGGFSLNLNLLNVYSVRADFVEHLEEIEGTFSGYFITVIKGFAGVGIPLYIYNSLQNKSRISVALGIFAQLCLFSLANDKGVLFIIPFIFAVYYLDKKDLLSSFKTMVHLGITGLFGIGIFERAIAHTSNVFFVIIRRMFFLPSYMSVAAYGFFKENPKVMWRQSCFLLQRILPNIYSKDSVFAVISDNCFKGAVPSPNSGLFTEAYMHFGAFGIFFYPILVLFVLRLIENNISEFGKGATILMAIIFSLSLPNVPITLTTFVMKVIPLVLVSLLSRKLKLR